MPMPNAIAPGTRMLSPASTPTSPPGPAVGADSRLQVTNSQVKSFDATRYESRDLTINGTGSTAGPGAVSKSSESREQPPRFKEFASEGYTLVSNSSQLTREVMKALGPDSGDTDIDRELAPRRSRDLKAHSTRNVNFEPETPDASQRPRVMGDQPDRVGDPRRGLGSASQTTPVRNVVAQS